MFDRVEQAFARGAAGELVEADVDALGDLVEIPLRLALRSRAPNCSAQVAYSASIRAGDGVVHGRGTTVDDGQRRIQRVRRLDGQVQRLTRPLFPAR